MNRIGKTFQELKTRNEKALVGFVTAGDPVESVSRKIIGAMCDNGIDILELGIPFSDPTADGPVIQRSSERALAAGMNMKIAMEMVAEIRRSSAVPIILFSYYNPIFAYGNERFYANAISAGADGVLVVDLPPEESDEFTECFAGDNFSLIRLIAPTTPKERMARIAQTASGFIYMVSKTGVTGSDGLDTSEIELHTKTLRSVTDLPVCVGFGISTPDDVAAVAKSADGVVIGSAFERTIEAHLDAADLADRIGKQTAGYKAATRKGAY